MGDLVKKKRVYRIVMHLYDIFLISSKLCGLFIVNTNRNFHDSLQATKK